MNQVGSIPKQIKIYVLFLLIVFFMGCNKAQYQSKYVGEQFGSYNIEKSDFRTNIDTIFSKYKGKYNKIPLVNYNSQREETIGYSYKIIDNTKKLFCFLNSDISFDLTEVISDNEGRIYSFSGSVEMPKSKINGYVEVYTHDNGKFKIDNGLSTGIIKSMKENDMHLYQYQFEDRFIVISLQKNENRANYQVKISVRNVNMPDQQLSELVKTYY